MTYVKVDKKSKHTHWILRGLLGALAGLLMVSVAYLMCYWLYQGIKPIFKLSSIAFVAMAVGGGVAGICNKDWLGNA